MCADSREISSPPGPFAVGRPAPSERSGDPYRVEEARDFGGEVLGLPRQFRGRIQGLDCRGACVLDGVGDTGDVGGDLTSARRRLTDVANDPPVDAP